jgi:signal transduction histidine kinase
VKTDTLGAKKGKGTGTDADGAQDAVARLACGVAHEINTPIQFVSDSLRFLNDAFDDVALLVDRWRDLFEAARTGPIPPALLADAEQALADADFETLRREIPAATVRALDGLARVADVVRRVRAIAPMEKPRELVDLRVVLPEIATLARVEFLKVADFEIEVDPALPLVDARGTDLHPLFYSLIARAARALAADPRRREERGRIRVAADVSGPSVRVAIEDDGPPIPSERCRALFQRRGDGDDLATVDETVRDVLGGRVLFESGVGHGTRFHLLFPIPPQVRAE